MRTPWALHWRPSFLERSSRVQAFSEDPTVWGFFISIKICSLSLSVWCHGRAAGVLVKASSSFQTPLTKSSISKLSWQPVHPCISKKLRSHVPPSFSSSEAAQPPYAASRHLKEAKKPRAPIFQLIGSGSASLCGFKA